MKGLYLLFVAIALAVAHTPKKPNCVRYIDCPTEDSSELMFINDPENCHNFYKCTKMICPKECPDTGNGNRLVWNSKEKVCDWSFNVPNLTNCPDINPPTSSSSSPSTSSSSPSTPSSSPSTPSSSPSTPSSSPSTPSSSPSTPSSSPSTPSSSPSTPSSSPSPSTPSSSPSTPSSSPSTPSPSPSTPSSSPSTSSSSPSTPSSSPSTPSSPTPLPSTPSISKCPESGTKNIPHESNCNLFYQCNNGKKTLKKCQQGHIFNPIISSCDLPENYPPCRKIIFPRKSFYF